MNIMKANHTPKTQSSADGTAGVRSSSISSSSSSSMRNKMFVVILSLVSTVLLWTVALTTTSTRSTTPFRETSVTKHPYKRATAVTTTTTTAIVATAIEDNRDDNFALMTTLKEAASTVMLSHKNQQDDTDEYDNHDELESLDKVDNKKLQGTVKANVTTTTRVPGPIVKLFRALPKPNKSPNKQGRTFVSTPEGYQHLFQEPFYVYEELIWFDSTWTTELGRTGVKGKPILKLLEQNYTFKHAEDLWFAAAALSHPMRTLDPKKAKLFVVPSLVGQAASKNVEYCWRGECNGQKLLKVVEEFLKRSPWFQRNNGNDHILVATDYYATAIMHNFPILQRCHMIGFENRQYNNVDRYTMPGYYMGTPCPIFAERPKQYDFTMVASMRDRKTFVHRHNICQWLGESKDKYNVPVCGHGRQCPALALSKYGFHVRGDTYGANRLMDTILSESVPIFTEYLLYKTLPDWIDWGQISEFASAGHNGRRKEKFLNELDDMLQNSTRYEEKLDAVKANKDLFEWRSVVPFDTYMFMLWWHLEEASSGVPPKVTVSSSYSALRLPTTQPLGAFKTSNKFHHCGGGSLHSDLEYGGMVKSCSECNQGCGSSACKRCTKGSKLEPIVNGTKPHTCVHVSHPCR